MNEFMAHDSESDHHAGLARDLQLFSTRLDRRRLLEWAACLGASALGCSGSSASVDGAGNLASDGSCSGIPDETEGPYPGDGTNGPNALGLSGIVRSDIRSSIGTGTGVAGGVLLEVRLRLMDTTCTALPGFAVYIWHCDREGRYSMYSSGAENENYLRGVQEADGDGVVAFTTIFPACYPGRWPHIHFEIYESLDAATDDGQKLRTSQIAIPEDICNEVFATSGYEQSVANLEQSSLDGDMVFSDGYASQLATASGSASEGVTLSLNIGV
jgi:protocatechuate 3,4-dioxygenase beta subunit